MSDRANISLYGKGVFTTVLLSNSELFLWEKHWERLINDAGKLGIDISGFDEPSVKDSVSKAVGESGLAKGRVRIAFLDASPSRMWGGSGNSQASLSILVAERRRLPQVYKLTASAFQINTTSPLAGIKSCNYLEPLLAFEEAEKSGSDEAIRLNQRGEVASACMANVHWLTDGRLYTPSLKTGCLAGTTREYVLANLECEEVEAGIDSLRTADGIFLSSAGVGVVRAAEFEGRKLQHGDHPIMRIVPA